MPDVKTLALLSLVGLMRTVGHFLLIQTHARAPASALTPYLSAQIAFALLCGLSASRLTARENQRLLTPLEG